MIIHVSACVRMCDHGHVRVYWACTCACAYFGRAPTWLLRMRIDTRPRGFLVGAAATVTRSLGAVQHLARRDGVVGDQSLGIQVSMESNRPLRKVCPQCDASLHVKRAACGCGHAFPSKRKAQCIAKREQ